MPFSRRIWIRICLGLLLVFVTGVWTVNHHVAENFNEPLDTLVRDLRVELPWYLEFVRVRLVGSKYLPRTIELKARHAEWNLDNRRWAAVQQLSKLGTNAWPAAPTLMPALRNSNQSLAIAAASALARIHADKHPDWEHLARQLKGNSRTARTFKLLISGRDRFAKPFDTVHKRFGLIGLSTVGPSAEIVISDISAVIRSKDDYELWPLAAIALKKAGGEPDEIIQFLLNVFQDAEEWPTIRAAALKALTTADPEETETRGRLTTALQDPSSYVRLAAAEGLWKLHAPGEEILPTLEGLLGHKLITIRTGALDLAGSMGKAAILLIPVVKQLTGADEPPVRRAAEAAFERIDG